LNLYHVKREKDAAMKTLVTLFFLTTALQVSGQIKISGRISDERGEVIPGANVFLEDTYDGASSNVAGRFEFVTHEQGKRILVVKFVGYKDFSKEIQIQHQDFVLDVILKETINELQAVTISAGAFTASEASRRTIFRALDIATTAGATADIAGALNSLPGTQKVGESGRLFVRGGDGNEVRTFIDGMVVLDAYSPAAPNTPSRGRFLPFMFKGMSFSTGGYSAEFGQALSSALVLESKDKAELIRTDFGILSVGGDVGHTQAWQKGSVGGKVQYTNLRPYVGLINQEIDWKKAPISMDGSVAFRQQVGKHGMIKVYGNFNRANFSLYHHDIDDNGKTQLHELENNYRYINAFHRGSVNKNWSIRSGLSYTYIRNENQFENLSKDDIEKGIHIKTVLEGSLSDHVEIKSGLEVIGRRYTQRSALDNFSEAFHSFDEAISAAFIEADMYASNRMVVRTGGRFEFNNLNSSISVDPRVSLAHKIGDNGQASVAYGKFRQSAKNEFLKIDHSLQAEKADHYILSYQYAKDNKTFRVETYYKEYRDLIKYTSTSSGDVDLSNQGSGDAKGIEIFWRDNGSVDNLDYWISYSWLNTKRNYLDFPYRATPAFASQHNFSIVTKYFVQQIKSQLGFTYSFASGRSYNDPNTETFNTSRTPNYADLSFNWSYLPSTSVIIYFSCTNILGRDNIFGYEYSSQRNEIGVYNGRPIRQAAPRFLFLGIFLTLSKDKSVNQLPNL
jgi:hypothetical protein